MTAKDHKVSVEQTESGLFRVTCKCGEITSVHEKNENAWMCGVWHLQAILKGLDIETPAGREG